jgi:hypothetical protein
MPPTNAPISRLLEAAVGVRRLASAWAAVNLLLIFVMLAGELGTGGSRPPAQAWLGLALWPIGVGVGLVICWFRARVGGWLTLVCLAGFYLWNYAVTGRILRGPYFALYAAPGVLFLLADWMNGRAARRS